MKKNNALEIGYFFPTAIGVCNDLLSFDELEKLQQVCKSLQKTVPNSVNGWLSGAQSPFNTMNTYNIINDTNFNNLNLTVNSKVAEFALHHSDNGNYLCENAWLNIYDENQYQEPHDHSAPCVYSAVFYVNASDKAGLFVVQSPFNHVRVERNHTNSNILTETKRWWKPQSNMLIIFKSTLNHYTTPNHGSRTSIAFNYKCYFGDNGTTQTPKPYPSWTLNANHDWQPPTPMPIEKGKKYAWFEPNRVWIELD